MADAIAATRLEVRNGADWRQHVVKSGRGCGQVRIDGGDDRIDGSDHRGRIGPGPDEERVGGKPVFGQRQVEPARVSTVKFGAANVAGDANDQIGRAAGGQIWMGTLIGGAQTKAAAHRILTGPKVSGRRFAENDFMRRFASLGWKAATQEQRNAEGLEVVRLNMGVVEDRLNIPGRVGMQRNGGRTIAEISGRLGAGQACDSGEHLQASTNFTHQGELIGRLPGSSGN